MFLRFAILILVFFTFPVLKGNDINDTIKNLHSPNPRAQFLKIGISGGKFSVRDNETSPLIYKGLLPGAQVGLSLYGRKMVTLFDFNFSSGKQSTRNYPDKDGNEAVAYSSYLNLSIARKFKVGNWTKTSLHVGGNMGLIANFRDNSKFNNANFNWEGFVTVGPMVLLEKEMNLSTKQLNLGLFRWPFRERTIKFSTSFSLPLLSAISRPLYTTIGDFVDGHSPSFNIKDMKFVSFDSFFNLVSTTSMSYFLENGNRLMLSYHWYYYDYHPSNNRVKGVAGLFSFYFLFRLNKK